MLIAVQLCTGKKEIIPEIGIRKMMNIYRFVKPILVFIFLFQSAKVVDECVKKYVKERADLGRRWGLVLSEVYFL